MNGYGMGFVCLNKDEQLAYDLFEEALRRKATSCDISRVKRSVNLMRVLTAVLGDNPDIIYLNKTMIRTLGSFFGKQISFVGCLPRKQAELCDIQLKKALEAAVWEIDKKAKNDKEILMGISEYLQRNVKYDMDELNSAARGKSISPMSHNAYGALVNHRAVCDGFSSAYALIVQYFGMRCMIVEGQSSYHGLSKTAHAWNIIEYDEDYFHVDSTWDANTYETIRTCSYDYFGLDDDEIAVDHEWDYKTTLRCSSNKLSYFVSNGLYAYSESQIEDIISRQMKRHEKVIRLKISPGISLNGDGQSQLEKIMMAAASRNCIATPYHYTWQSATRCLIITFDDFNLI